MPDPKKNIFGQSLDDLYGDSKISPKTGTSISYSDQGDAVRLDAPLSKLEEYTGRNRAFVDQGALTPFIDTYQGRAEVWGNAAKRVIPSAAIMFAEGIAGIANVPDWFDSEETVNTGFMQLMDEWKQDLREGSLKNYQSEPMDFTSSAFWADFGEGLGASILSFAAIGGAVGKIGKGVKSLSQLNKLINSGSKGKQLLGQVLDKLGIVSTAATLNQAETVMITSQYFHDTKRQLIAEGFSEKEAHEKAAEGASFLYKINRTNILLNLGTAKIALGGNTFWREAKKQVHGGTTVAKEMLQESVEEAAQHAYETQAEAVSRGENPSFLKGVQSIFTPEGALAAFGGALGGGVQTGLITALTSKSRKERNEAIKQQEELTQIIASGLATSIQDLNTQSKDNNGSLSPSAVVDNMILSVMGAIKTTDQLNGGLKPLKNEIDAWKKMSDEEAKEAFGIGEEEDYNHQEAIQDFEDLLNNTIKMYRQMEDLGLPDEKKLGVVKAFRDKEVARKEAKKAQSNYKRLSKGIAKDLSTIFSPVDNATDNLTRNGEITTKGIQNPLETYKEVEGKIKTLEKEKANSSRDNKPFKEQQTLDNLTETLKKLDLVVGEGLRKAENNLNTANEKLSKASKIFDDSLSGKKNYKDEITSNTLVTGDTLETIEGKITKLQDLRETADSNSLDAIDRAITNLQTRQRNIKEVELKAATKIIDEITDDNIDNTIKDSVSNFNHETLRKLLDKVDSLNLSDENKEKLRKSAEDAAQKRNDKNIDRAVSFSDLNKKKKALEDLLDDNKAPFGFTLTTEQKSKIEDELAYVNESLSQKEEHLKVVQKVEAQIQKYIDEAIKDFTALGKNKTVEDLQALFDRVSKFLLEASDLKTNNSVAYKAAGQGFNNIKQLEDILTTIKNTLDKLKKTLKDQALNRKYTPIQSPFQYSTGRTGNLRNTTFTSITNEELSKASKEGNLELALIDGNSSVNWTNLSNHSNPNAMVSVGYGVKNLVLRNSKTKEVYAWYPDPTLIKVNGEPFNIGDNTHITALNNAWTEEEKTKFKADYHKMIDLRKRAEAGAIPVTDDILNVADRLTDAGVDKTKSVQEQLDKYPAEDIPGFGKGHLMVTVGYNKNGGVIYKFYFVPLDGPIKEVSSTNIFLAERLYEFKSKYKQMTSSPNGAPSSHFLLVKGKNGTVPIALTYPHRTDIDGDQPKRADITTIIEALNDSDKGFKTLSDLEIPISNLPSDKPISAFNEKELKKLENYLNSILFIKLNTEEPVKFGIKLYRKEGADKIIPQLEMFHSGTHNEYVELKNLTYSSFYEVMHAAAEKALKEAQKRGNLEKVILEPDAVNAFEPEDNKTPTTKILAPVARAYNVITIDSSKKLDSSAPSKETKEPVWDIEDAEGLEDSEALWPVVGFEDSEDPSNETPSTPKPPFNVPKGINTIDDDSEIELQLKEDKEIDTDYLEALGTLKELIPESLISNEELEEFLGNVQLSGIPLGAVVNSMVALSKGGVNRTTAPHEAFHIVSKVLLDPKTHKRMMTAAKSLYTPTAQQLNKLRNSSSSYAALSQEQLTELWYEEKLADEFADYYLKQKTKAKRPILKKVFDTIAKWVKWLASPFNSTLRNADIIESLFKNIANGKYKGGPVKTASHFPMFQLMRYEYVNESGKFAGYLNSQQSINIVSRIVSNYVQNNGLDPNYTFDQAYKAIQQYYSVENWLEELTALNSVDSEKAMSAYREISNMQAAMFYTKTTEEGKEISNKEYFIREAMSYTKMLQVEDSYHAIGDEVIEDAEDTEGPKENWGFENREIGGTKSLSKQMKMFLTGIYIAGDEFGLGIGNELRVDPTLAKYQTPLDFYVTYRGLVRGMSNVPRHKKLERLYNLAQDNVNLKHFYQALVTKMGIPNWAPGEPIQNQDNQFYNMFLSSMALYTHKSWDTIYMPGYETLSDDETVKTLDANSRDVAQQQVDNWKVAFKARLGRSVSQEQYDRAIEIIRSLSEPSYYLIDNLNKEDGVYFLNKENIQGYVDEVYDAFQTIGFNISKAYIRFSAIQAFNEMGDTNMAENLLSYVESFPEMKTIQELLESKGDKAMILLGTAFYEGKYQGDIFSNDKDKGILSRLLDIANNNAVFDETVGESSYLNQEDKRIYEHIQGTFPSERAIEIRNKSMSEFIDLLKENKEEEAIISFASNWNFNLGERIVNEDGTVSYSNKEEYRNTLLVMHFLKNNMFLNDQSLLDSYALGMMGGMRVPFTYLKGGKIVEVDSGKGVTWGSMTPIDKFLFPMLQFIQGLRKKSRAPGYTLINIGTNAEKNTNYSAMLPIQDYYYKDSITNKGVRDVLNLLRQEYERIIYTKKYTDLPPLKGFHANRANHLTQFKIFSDETIQLIEEKAEKGIPFDNIIEEVTPIIKEEIDTRVDTYIKYLGDLGIKFSDLPKYYTEGEGLNKSAIANFYLNDFILTASHNQLFRYDEAMAFANSATVVKRNSGMVAAGPPMYNGQRNMGFVSVATVKSAEKPLIDEINKDNPNIDQAIITKAGKTVDRSDGQSIMTMEAYESFYLAPLGKLNTGVKNIIYKMKRGYRISPKEQAALLNTNANPTPRKLVYRDGLVYLKTSVHTISRHITSYLDESQESKSSQELVYSGLDRQGNPVKYVINEKDGKKELKPIYNNEVADIVLNKVSSESSDLELLEGYIDGEAAIASRYSIREKVDSLYDKVQKLEKRWETSTTFEESFDIGRQIAVIHAEINEYWKPIPGMEEQHKTLNKMLAGGIDYLAYDSASKMVKDKVLNSVDDIPSASENKHTYSSDLYSGNFREQVATDGVKKEILHPTQLIQLIWSEQNPDVEINTYGKSFLTKDVVETYINNLALRNYKKYEKLSNDLIDEDGNLNHTLIRDVVEKAIVASGSDVSLMEYAQSYNFNLPSIIKKIESILYSFLSKKTLSSKVPGFKATLVADNLWDVVVDDNNNVISYHTIAANPSNYAEHKRRRLKHAVMKADGNLYSEAIIPAFLAELTGLKPGDSLPAELAKMFGVRIPTQDKHSMVGIEVVSVLPKEYGNMLVLPYEATIILAGADFDIDAEYIQRLATYKDDSGTLRSYGSYLYNNNLNSLLTEVQDIMQNEIPDFEEQVTALLTSEKLLDSLSEKQRKLLEDIYTEERDNRLLHEFNRMDFDEYKSSQNKLARKKNNLLKVLAVKARNTKRKEYGIPINLSELRNSNLGNRGLENIKALKEGKLNGIQHLSVEGINNMLLDLQISLHHNVGNSFVHNTPTSMIAIDESVEKVIRLKYGNEKADKILKEKNYTDIRGTSDAIDKHKAAVANDTGAKNIGIYALGNIMLQWLHRLDSKDSIIKRSHRSHYGIDYFGEYIEGKGLVKPTHKEDTLGNTIYERINDQIDTYLSASTDNGKDPKAVVLNLNDKSAGAHVIGLMTIPKEILDLMFANPLVGRMLNDLNNKTVLKSSDSKELIINKYKKRALSTLENTSNEVVTNLLNPDEFTKALEHSIRLTGEDNEELTQESPISEEQITTANYIAVTEVIKLLEIADVLFNYSQILSLSKGFKSSTGRNGVIPQYVQNLINPKKELPIESAALESLLSEPYIRSMLNVFMGVHENILSKVFVTNSPIGSIVIGELLSSINEDSLQYSDTLDSISEAFTSFLSQRLYTTLDPSIRDETELDLLEDESFHNLYNDLIAREDLKDNNFLRFLVPETQEFFSGPLEGSTMYTFRTDSRNTIDRNAKKKMQDDFHTLLKMTKDPKVIEFAKRIFNHARRKEGFMFKSNGISTALPPVAFKRLSNLLDSFMYGDGTLIYDLQNSLRYKEFLTEISKEFALMMMLNVENKKLWKLIPSENTRTIPNSKSISIKREHTEASYIYTVTGSGKSKYYVRTGVTAIMGIYSPVELVKVGNLNPFIFTKAMRVKIGDKLEFSENYGATSQKILKELNPDKISSSDMSAKEDKGKATSDLNTSKEIDSLNQTLDDLEEC